MNSLSLGRGSRRGVFVALVALALALVIARPRDAAAQGIGVPTFSCDGGCGVLLVGGVLVGGFQVVGGIVTDGVIAHRLASRNAVDHGWAVAGTVIWSINTAVAVPSLIAVLASDPSLLGGLTMGALTLFSGASLALSIYGLTRPPPPRVITVPGQVARARPRHGSSLQLLGLGPTMVPSHAGPQPGVGLSVAF